MSKRKAGSAKPDEYSSDGEFEEKRNFPAFMWDFFSDLIHRANEINSSHDTKVTIGEIYKMASELKIEKTTDRAGSQDRVLRIFNALDYDAIVIHQTRTGKVVLKGLDRLQAIKGFIDEDFDITMNGHAVTWKRWSHHERIHFHTRTLRLVTLRVPGLTDEEMRLLIDE